MQEGWDSFSSKKRGQRFLGNREARRASTANEWKNFYPFFVSSDKKGWVVGQSPTKWFKGRSPLYRIVRRSLTKKVSGVFPKPLFTLLFFFCFPLLSCPAYSSILFLLLNDLELLPTVRRHL